MPLVTSSGTVVRRSFDPTDRKKGRLNRNLREWTAFDRAYASHLIETRREKEKVNNSLKLKADYKSSENKCRSEKEEETWLLLWMIK